MTNRLNQIIIPIAVIIVVTWMVMRYRTEKLQEKKENQVQTMLKFMKKRT